MSRKIEVGLAIASLFIGLAAWQFPKSSESRTSDTGNKYAPPAYEKLLPNKALLVSGTGAIVKVVSSENGTKFPGGEISSTGSESTIYIPIGQNVTLKVTGTGAQVFVQSNLLPYLNVINVATGASIHEI